MKTTTTITSVRAYFKADTYSLRLELKDACVPCYHYDDNGELVEDKSNALYLPVSVLIAQLCNADARFGVWFAHRRDAALGSKQHPFAPTVAETVLVNAVLTIESDKHSVGEEYTASDGSTATYQCDCFSHKIIDVQFAADINAALGKYLPKDRAQVIADLF